MKIKDLDAILRRQDFWSNRVGRFCRPWSGGSFRCVRVSIEAQILECCRRSTLWLFSGECACWSFAASGYWWDVGCQVECKVEVLQSTLVRRHDGKNSCSHFSIVLVVLIFPINVVAGLRNSCLLWLLHFHVHCNIYNNNESAQGRSQIPSSDISRKNMQITSGVSFLHPLKS